MRFISIEKDKSTERVLVNVQNIASIDRSPDSESLGYKGTVSLHMANGQSIATKFTDVEHAVDYIQRAPSVSMGGLRATVD